MAKTLHVVSILDRSGSMWNAATEVIGAYNSFIEDQKKLAKDKNLKIKTSLILFDDKYEEVYSKVPVEQTPKLDETVYNTRGMTALYDAIGKTVSSFDDKKNVLMFIETDGHENASNEYSGDALKELVKKKTKAGWDFNFVGADLDAVTTQSISGSIGISASNSTSFAKTASGYATRNATFMSSTMNYVDKNMKPKEKSKANE